MAYNIISNAKFRPFTYKELSEPLVQYKEAYDKIENEFSNLATMTEAWKNVANREKNPEAYKLYSKFAGDLSKALSSFSKGMTLQNRRALFDLKSRYTGEIGQISRAAEMMEKAQKAKEEIRSRNPNAVFEEEDDYGSIDKYLHKVSPNYNYWNGDAAFKRIAVEAEAIGKAFFSDPTAEVFFKGQKVKIGQLNGMPPEKMEKILLDPKNATTEAGKAMRAIYDREYGAIDTDRYSTRGLAAINNVIRSAMTAGLAKPTYTFGANEEYISAAQNRSLNLQERELNLRKKEYEDNQKLKGIKPISVDQNGHKFYIGKDGIDEYNSNGTYVKTHSTKSNSPKTTQTSTFARNTEGNMEEEMRVVTTTGQNDSDVDSQHQQMVNELLRSSNKSNESTQQSNDATVPRDGLD